MGGTEQAQRSDQGPGATVDGLPAIRQLISEGINVNVTLLFGLTRYRQVAESYIAGLEARAGQGKPVKHIASVASFFLSRIDTMVDPLAEKILESGTMTNKQGIEEANWILARLPELGISIDKVTQQLEDEGVGKFIEPFDKLMKALMKKSSK